MLKYVLEFRETGSRKATTLAYNNPASQKQALQALLEGMGPRDDVTIRLYTEPVDLDPAEYAPRRAPETTGLQPAEGISWEEG